MSDKNDVIRQLDNIENELQCLYLNGPDAIEKIVSNVIHLTEVVREHIEEGEDNE